MASESKTIKIGELLEKAGLVSSSELSDKLEISSTIGQPLGQTLVQLGTLTENQLLSVVELQSLLLDGALDLDAAVEAVRFVCLEDICLEDALKRIGFTSGFAEGSRLGKLLLEAGLISKEVLWNALTICIRDCRPLGHALLEGESLPPAALAAALSVQKRIRTGEIDMSEGLKQLREHAPAR